MIYLLLNSFNQKTKQNKTKKEKYSVFQKYIRS